MHVGDAVEIMTKQVKVVDASHGQIFDDFQPNVIGQIGPATWTLEEFKSLRCWRLIYGLRSCTKRGILKRLRSRSDPVEIPTGIHSKMFQK